LRSDCRAQQGDPLVDGLVAALDQPVGVQAQHRARREAQGAHLAAPLAGDADEHIGSDVGQDSGLAGAADDGRQVPGGANAYVAAGGADHRAQHGRYRVGLEISTLQLVIGEWRNRGGHA
jgi:hypothetical protein